MKRYCCPMCCNVIYEEVFANLPDEWHSTRLNAMKAFTTNIHLTRRKICSEY